MKTKHYDVEEYVTKAKLASNINSGKYKSKADLARKLGMSTKRVDFWLDYYKINFYGRLSRKAAIEKAKKDKRIINKLMKVIMNKFIIIENDDYDYSYILTFEDGNYTLLTGVYKINPKKMLLRKIKLRANGFQFFNKTFNNKIIFLITSKMLTKEYNLIIKYISDKETNDLKYLLRNNVKGFKEKRK